ncbi:MAG: hypothetical protein U0556_08315 [Dehalococcoidia bacterium]
MVESSSPAVVQRRFGAARLAIVVLRVGAIVLLLLALLVTIGSCVAAGIIVNNAASFSRTASASFALNLGVSFGIDVLLFWQGMLCWAGAEGLRAILAIEQQTRQPA